MPLPIIIFAAVDMEAKAIRRFLPDSDIAVYTVGIGARHLPKAASVRGASMIILAGIGGGLDPSLKIGDVIIDDPDGLIPPSVKCRRGMIATANQIITGPDEKAKLFADTGAIVVEMEGERVRAFAKKLGLPCVGVRAVSDTAEDFLDPEVVGLVDDFGRVKPLRLSATLLRKPSLMPYLNQLGKNARIAVEQLGETVREIVESLKPG